MLTSAPPPIARPAEPPVEALAAPSPAANLRQIPDVPAEEPADGMEREEAANTRPENPDQDNDLSDLPPEVLAALSSIPADSPDSLGIVLPKEALSTPAVTPPPLPANPRLVQPQVEPTETLIGSWITLSIPGKEERIYAVWEISDWERTAAKRKGGEALAVRLYDVTGQPTSGLLSDPVDEQECYELARDWYITLPKRDRTYVAEIGYKTATGGWLSLARSSSLSVAAQ